MTYRVYDAISYAGDTALMYATMYGNGEVVQALQAAKADVNAKDYIGRTALMLASEAGRDEVVKLLRQAGAKEYPL
jgi:ankyrin repeat protein